jgi:hypothetical protein
LSGRNRENADRHAAAAQGRSRAFIDGKIDMIRRDPNMPQADKNKAIQELESKR